MAELDQPTISVALQEWAACCHALGDGRIILSVRKGGIHERGGGLFQPEHQRFALMPTYLHQEALRVRAAFQDDVVTADPTPGQHRISVWADVAHVWKVTSLLPLIALGPELLWTQDELSRRFSYREERWLYVLALRIMRLPQPVIIPDRPSYAGCRSWIPLDQTISTEGSIPVLSTGTFEIRSERIGQVLAPGRSISRVLNVGTKRVVPRRPEPRP